MQEGFERMLKGFKEFLDRGNIVDLAVAVVIGTAFTALSRSSPTASSRR
jgi:large-conductance mechanosensitive channel